jgi:hypothetical protein
MLWSIVFYHSDLTLYPFNCPTALQEIIKKDGLSGLFGRGLGTKLITNGIQGILFSVLWRLGQVRVWAVGCGGWVAIYLLTYGEVEST